MHPSIHRALAVTFALVAWPGFAARPTAAETTQCTVITSLPATITVQGIYCLVSDFSLSLASGVAVRVETNNVVIDLNGHKIGNVPNAIRDGARATSTHALTRSYFSQKAPVIAGAIGGSGTRVVAHLLESSGIYVGAARNISEDAMEFVEFYDRWINRYARRHELPLTPSENQAMTAAFRGCIVRHPGLLPDDADWGWKEPRSVYLLPLLHALMPSVKFIHLIRSGLDMAFSSNQNQLRKHGDAVLGEAFEGLSAPVRSGALWSAVNGAAADYGETFMKESYLRIRFEDLCWDPVSVTAQVFGFLGRSSSTAHERIDATRPGLGRWRACADEALLAQIRQHAGASLSRFGYFD